MEIASVFIKHMVMDRITLNAFFSNEHYNINVIKSCIQTELHQDGWMGRWMDN